MGRKLDRSHESFSQKGDTVVDIGANIGTVSIALAHAVGESGKVYAFECQEKFSTIYALILCLILATIYLPYVL